ncbi:L domain-like protein [Fistulina hepatica ATCC 64428]|nr:L domain-like protein [Fistulina hepatica ATCC 64428]
MAEETTSEASKPAEKIPETTHINTQDTGVAVYGSVRVATTVSADAVSDDEEDRRSGDNDSQEGPDADFLEGYPDDTEELDLIHLRIKTLEVLNLPRFAAHLRQLCLRQNEITHLDPESLSPLTQLEELDLYDNKLKHIDNALDNLQKLGVLDLSFNIFKSIPECINRLAALHTVYFVQNRISTITHLELTTRLRSLELGGNRIRKIENLDTLVNLEELWLGKNKITRLENLGSLKKLRILSIQSNRITVLEGLEELVDLQELYVSDNGIKRIDGLQNNLNLTTLDVGSNFIEKIENVSHLQQLEELWMSGNKIPDLGDLEPELGKISNLQTIYLEHNPCQTADPTGYRRKIMLALPQLTQIDATFTR